MDDPRIEIYRVAGPDGDDQYRARLLNMGGIVIHQNLITPKRDVRFAFEAVRAFHHNFLNVKYTYSPDGVMVDSFRKLNR